MTLRGYTKMLIQLLLTSDHRPKGRLENRIIHYVNIPRLAHPSFLHPLKYSSFVLHSISHQTVSEDSNIIEKVPSLRTLWVAWYYIIDPAELSLLSRWRFLVAGLELELEHDTLFSFPLGIYLKLPHGQASVIWSYKLLAMRELWTIILHENISRICHNILL